MPIGQVQLDRLPELTEGLVVEFPTELELHQRRLMDVLGVTVVIREEPKC